MNKESFEKTQKETLPFSSVINKAWKLKIHFCSSSSAPPPPNLTMCPSHPLGVTADN